MSGFLTARTKAELVKQLEALPGWESQPDKYAINAYQCHKCTKCILVYHADRGTTPMFMGCKATEGCEGRMNSAGYPSTPPPLESRTWSLWEWYRPEAGPLGMFHEDQLVDEHIRRGGLLLRKKRDAQ